MHRVRVACLTLILLAGSGGTSEAGPFRWTGYDARAVGQGGGQGAYGEGLGVLYSNPALMTDLAEQFGFSLVLFQPGMKAALMARPQNADVPITLYDSDVGIQGSNLDRPLPTVELPNRRADNTVNEPIPFIGVGLITSLGLEDFRLGLSLLLPVKGLASVQSMYHDEREQSFSNTLHFPLFGEWSQVLSLLAGLAYRPVPWLSVGASVEGALTAAVPLNMYIPEATVQDYALVNVGVDAKPGLRAILGVNARPLDWLSGSLVWRDRRFSRVDARAYLNLWNYHEAGDSTVPKRVVQHHLLDLDYEPMEVSLSAGARIEALSAQLTVTWNHWAEFLDTHNQRPQRVAVMYPTSATDEDPGFAFSDTFSVNLGVAWEYLPGFSATAGAGYHPTPVPAQVGRTNYLDSDKIDLALGHRFDFTLWGRAVRADVGLQFWHLFKTTVNKDPSMIRDEFPDDARTLIGGEAMPEAAGLQTNNPGFPGFTLSGFSLAGAASLSYLF